MEKKVLITELNMPIQYLKGVGEKRGALLTAANIITVGDLLQYYPRTYEDRSKLKSIFSLQDGKRETFKGTVITYEKNRFPRKGKDFTKVIISDGTGYAHLMFFYTVGLEKSVPIGTKVIVSGRVKRYRQIKQIVDFEYETITENEDPSDHLHTNRVVPIYPLTEKLSVFGGQKLLRRLIKQAIDEYGEALTDIIPTFIRVKYHLPEICWAINQIHFPESQANQRRARARIVFEEFFLLQLAFGIMRRDIGLESKGISYTTGTGQLLEKFIKKLGFPLTNAQKRVIAQIKEDMISSHPMNRLIHGDVGSGKTVVAISAALIAIECGYQAALMAPTELLAEQHYLNLKDMLLSIGVNICLLTSSTKKKIREELLQKIGMGEIALVIGTHSLIQETVLFHKLGLCIVDEQHRFGVIQRGLFRQKAQIGSNVNQFTPDVLVMTATPIPRTLALTLYGDLEISVIDELPEGRVGIITKCRSEKSLPQIFAFIEKEIQAGRQAYIIYPLIEESEELNLKAATTRLKELQSDVFPELRLALLHGQMKSEEREITMRAFYNREIDILVATTVIEVGIDVPNATIMLIEHAERFGLAQLHQLRGRVGRGGHKSYCILITYPPISNLVNSESYNGEFEDQTLSKAVARLKALVDSCDGFKIAEVDLEIRGPGEFFGTRQHGLPELKLAHLIYDIKWLELARQEAFSLLETDPQLSNHEYIFLRKIFQCKFGDKLHIATI